MSLSDDEQVNKAEKAWKPTATEPTQNCGTKEDDNAEQAETQELFERLRCILDNLTSQNFQEQMKQVTELKIDTEERLKGVIDLIYEKAISEPNLVYPNMCRCLLGLKVLIPDKPGHWVNFRKLLLNHCQTEFEKSKDDNDKIFEEKLKEFEAAKEGEERERLSVELQESRDQAHHRSLGNIRFIGELFKLKVLTEAVMHDCIVKLLKNRDDESLECLCVLLSTTGKGLDHEKAKPRMDQYYKQIGEIIKEGMTSSRIRSMLQDVLDLRRLLRTVSSSMFLSYDMQLNKAEKAWKPGVKKFTQSRGAKEAKDDDAEMVKTRKLFWRLRYILDNLTPQNFRQQMKQVTELTIDTEERLKGTIHLIYEKAISDPNLVYPNMCRCLMGLKIPISDNPGCYVNFRKLLLNRCQIVFEKSLDDNDELFEEKQKEIEAAKEGEERERLSVKLQEYRNQAHHCSLGNIRFIGELFKLKMLTEAIVHDCIVKLLKNGDDKSLECLCMLLSTTGKDLDHEKAKPRMDQYYNKISEIIKEGKTSSRIRSMLQDVLDLRRRGLRKEPGTVSSSMFLSYDIQPNKAEKAWNPMPKKSTQSRGAKVAKDDDAEKVKTQEMLERLRCILDSLTALNFQVQMKQVTELKIDTEERLKGAIDLIYEKAISDPNLAYPNMCRCLMGLKVQISDKPGCTVNFRKLLLDRCQIEFEKSLDDDDEIFEEKQKEIEAAKEGEERERLSVELQESRDQAHHRSLGNIRFMVELFKLKMLTEVIMHDCIVKLLKNGDDESLECLCVLLSTTGKALDHEKAKLRMDQYYNKISEIIKEGKTSSRIRSMLQDVLDLRRSS